MGQAQARISVGWDRLMPVIVLAGEDPACISVGLDRLRHVLAHYNPRGRRKPSISFFTTGVYMQKTSLQMVPSF